MKCFFHETVDAVATCKDCNKMLCKVCVANPNPCLCKDCLEMRKVSAIEGKKANRKNALIDTNAEFLIAILKGVAAAVLLPLIFTAMGSGSLPFPSIFLFFVPFGWAVITYVEQWLPDFWVSWVIVLFYLGIKLLFSIVFGIPCFAFQVIKYIYKLIKPVA